MPLESLISESAYTSIFATFRLVQFAVDLKCVPDCSRIFVRLVEQVAEDVEHALRCRADGARLFEHCPEFYRKWSSNAIDSTLRALDELGQLILRGAGNESKLDARLEYLLKNYDKLADQERSLNYSHATLLAAISAMHMMVFQAGTYVARPSWSPMSSGDLGRASSQRPAPSWPSVSRQTSFVSTLGSSEATSNEKFSLCSDIGRLNRSNGAAYAQRGECTPTMRSSTLSSG
ncbi:uncharacterized protein F5Z01DRAFT_74326 [Emericellopsis atlantica]|uniref:Uncharacterized protein n=1 Tax=Emericellopsis atlantica TaxID=2614577 RepID=A0A9P8CQG3_9HYPO|nr:uncharacterized protein F5Z01DRAFT_74326 [Emericellopsis atlantica]KAG9255090.1 hypothetical protein F5Z01DRAFT_74326 [Emericellopsis atlantica]